MITMSLDTNCLKKVVVHYVGSKNNLEQVILSEEENEPGDDEMKILQDGFLQRFKSIGEQYAFHHISSLEYNEVYNYCRKVFEDENNFITSSHSIAKHLYEASVHPKVRGGEFYVVFFEGLPVNSRMHKAIGLFKTEHKLFYMDVKKKKHQLLFELKEGVEVSKIDKGCLIIDNNKDQGYDIMIFDNQNRGEEAQYWKENFLGIQPQKNEFHHTQHFLTLTRQFITGELESEHQMEKTEQVELLNRSLDYFKSHDAFDIDEFQQEVFVNEQIIDSFRDFGSKYTTVHDFDIASGFGISPEAVKKQTRIFKSIVKLDRNFHIYIHGRTDLIEKGVEADGRKFYKIYYQEEA
jgi:hypothetical protein